MTHLPKNTQRGFSLTELLVVAFIVTAVTTMPVLNSTAILPNYKANSAMNQVLGQLRAARQQAISHRREVQVQFVGNNQITLSELVAGDGYLAGKLCCSGADRFFAKCAI